MSATTTVDPTRCPLCGERNLCVLASGAEPGTPCWCGTVSIPAATLALVPEQAKNVACICRACAEKRPASPTSR